MTIDKINEMHKSVIQLLKNNELKEAFDLIQQLIEQEKVYSLQEKLQELQDTYLNMLRYRMSGVKDPMEKKIHLDLTASIAELADRARLEVLTRISYKRYYTIRRNTALSTALSLNELYVMLRDKHNSREEVENFNHTLFSNVWTAGLLSTGEVEVLKNILFDPSILLEVKCTTVAALMLALMEMFDKEKLLLLFDVADQSEGVLKLRSYVSLFLSLYLCKERTSMLPQISNRLEALSENKNFVRILRNVTMSFINARDTEKVTDKIREEILPEMMKVDKLINNLSSSKNSIREQLESGLNPEWGKSLFDKKFEKALDEYKKLQLEGADVMHMSFTNMKNFPFFQEMSNWFMPFSLDQSLLSTSFNRKEEKFFNSMFYAVPLCDSDKYSLVFSLLRLPSYMRQGSVDMFKSLSNEMDLSPDWKEFQQDPLRKEEEIIRLFIQDLYRFFKLHPLHGEFEDVFLLDLDFYNVPLLQQYLSDMESLSAISDYYMRKSHFEEALRIFDRWMKKEENDILWQKIGYCKQMMEDWQGALDAYLRSELMNASSGKWLVTHIAICYRALGQPDMALTYYKKYEASHPDDLSVEVSIGNCYLSLKNYNEALKYFFKVDYLETKSHKAWRPIAWCSLLAGKYDQARSYYQKLIDNKPSVQDYLNAGHTEWTMQNVKGAMDLYRKGIKKQGNIDEFFDLFCQDLPSLSFLGIEKEEVEFMQEQLRYYVEGRL